MSSGSAITGPQDRSLNRRSSKSRLEKQHEVEAEDPPGGRGAPRIETAKKAPFEPENATKANESNSKGSGDTEYQETSLTKIQIPETRVESFDVIEVDDDEKGVPTKSKILVRSHALCGDDDTKLNARGIEKQGSTGSSLSRDSSNELYTDSTGINLEEFIINTLHKNPRDRTFLLDMEQTLRRFINDPSKTIHRFPTMSSYNRMLIHRVAAFFGLDHNVDQSGQAVVVSRNQTTRIPDIPFHDYIKGDLYTDEPKKLLKRDAQSYEEAQARSLDQLDIRKARSFEEREEEYVKARTRIFNQQDSYSSMEGVMESPVRPWSSTDSSSDQSQISFMQMQRAQLMQKAGSFGGVPSFYRGDGAKTSPRRSNTESTRDVVGFSLQPTIPEAASGPASPLIVPAGQPVVFAVASIEQVPPGAIIINAQTGQPYINQDGSVYHHCVIPPRPLSAASSPSYAPPVAPTLHPLCGTSVAADPSASIMGQMQQLSLMQPASVSVSPDLSRPSVAPHPQMYYGAPQVYTYVMSQQQLQQPTQLHTSEGSPQHLPTISSQPTTLIPAQTIGLQPVSMNYPESLPYAVHTGSIAYTQASSQGTVSMTSSSMGYRMFYPAHAHSPIPVGIATGQPHAPVMISPTEVPYATQQQPVGWAEGLDKPSGVSFASEQYQGSSHLQFGNTNAGTGYATSLSSGDSAAVGYSGSSHVTATVSEGISDSNSSAGVP